ncbi:MAG TPA: helix-turn-helix transcriptional regulator [Roseiarcus sp.]|jgi:transcriptional regulator with XRE-family HTH domain
MSITIGQVKEARGLLAWSQDDLAMACGIETSTVVNFEFGKQLPGTQTLEDIRAALEAAGIEFRTDEARAVKLTKSAIRSRAEQVKTKPSVPRSVEGEGYLDWLLSEFAAA